MESRVRADTNYAGPERRAQWHTPADCEKMLNVEKRFTDGTERMKRIEDSIDSLKEAHTRFEAKLDENNATTAEAADAAKQIAIDTADIRDIMNLGKSFFRLAGYLGTFLKWGSGIAAALFTIYYMFVHGRPPP